MRIWSNGKISLCQGEDAGSIPAIRPWYNKLKALGIVDYDGVIVLSFLFFPSPKIVINY